MAKKLSRKLESLILLATKNAGTYKPEEALPFVEEQLTGAEFKQAEGFLRWVHDNGKKFGWNIQERYAEYCVANGRLASWKYPA